MKIYVLVYINIYSLIYFLCIIIMSQPFSYYGLYTFTNYGKSFENQSFNSLHKSILYSFPLLQQFFSSNESVAKGPKTLIYIPWTKEN
jgi:hypothetical protein